MSLQRIVPGFRKLPLDWTNPHLTAYLRYFDIDFYRTHKHSKGQADLEHLTRVEAAKHFVLQGWRERRAYSRFLHAFCETAFYLEAYPELNLEPDGGAMQHWMYEGFLEGRDPNRVTQQLREATYHVFNMGKCGSRSVVEAIRQAAPAATVVHAHASANFAQIYPDCFWSYPELLARNPKPVRFVAGVRDPFSRAVAGYLQDYQPAILSGKLAWTDELLSRMLAEMTAALKVIVSWFDHGFHCGIDVYASPFDTDRGHTVYGSGGRQAFVYKLDKLPQLEQPLGEFLDLPINLERHNVAADKGSSMEAFHAETYRSIRFRHEIVTETLASRFVRQFYTADEIEALRDRWSA
jgi:hypothetical protein